MGTASPSSDCRCTYFKDFIIEDVGTKDHHPVGVQHRMHASGKGPGDSLLTVHNESDRLTLHSYSHMVPPKGGVRRSRDSLVKAGSWQGWAAASKRLSKGQGIKNHSGGVGSIKALLKQCRVDSKPVALDLVQTQG